MIITDGNAVNKGELEEILNAIKAINGIVGSEYARKLAEEEAKKKAEQEAQNEAKRKSRDTKKSNVTDL